MFKSQSAMEYLMTYGWAILIIAVVLAVLYQLGVFGTTSFIGTSCLASPGYLCSSPVMNSLGYLSVTLGQSGTQSLSITGVACTNSTTAPNSMGFNSVSLTIASGGQVSQVFFCPGVSPVLGSPFRGYLWLQYNGLTQNGLETQFATISAAVSTGASVGNAPGGGAPSGPAIVYGGGTDTLSLTLPSAYAYYFCGGASGSGVSSPSWTVDATSTFASIGHQGSGMNTCSFADSGYPQYASIAGAAVDGISSYALQSEGSISGTGIDITYTSSGTSQYTIIILSTIYAASWSFTPSGCTLEEDQGPAYGSAYSWVYIYQCDNQVANTYGISGTLASGAGNPVYNTYAVYTFT